MNIRLPTLLMATAQRVDDDGPNVGLRARIGSSELELELGINVFESARKSVDEPHNTLLVVDGFVQHDTSPQSAVRASFGYRERKLPRTTGRALSCPKRDSADPGPDNQMRSTLFRDLDYRLRLFASASRNDAAAASRWLCSTGFDHRSG